MGASRWQCRMAAPPSCGRAVGDVEPAPRALRPRVLPLVFPTPIRVGHAIDITIIATINITAAPGLATLGRRTVLPEQHGAARAGGGRVELRARIYLPRRRDQAPPDKWTNEWIVY